MTELLNILIADDESIIRMGIKAMLAEMGHTVYAAANGREALAFVRRHQLDLAILDIRMPYTDGLQAAETIKRTHPMPIIFLTSYSDADTISTAVSLSAHGYLIKPIKPRELYAAIEVARNLFNQSKQLEQDKQALVTKLEARQVIERAKGILMTQRNCTEEQAYHIIQQTARAKQLSMRVVAEAILRSEK